MKRTCEKSENSHAASVESSAWSSDHPRQRTTLSMIVTELEKLETDWQSLCAMITTKGNGAMRLITSLFTKSP